MVSWWFSTPSTVHAMIYDKIWIWRSAKKSNRLLIDDLSLFVANIINLTRCFSGHHYEHLLLIACARNICRLERVQEVKHMLSQLTSAARNKGVDGRCQQTDTVMSTFCAIIVCSSHHDDLRATGRAMRVNEWTRGHIITYHHRVSWCGGWWPSEEEILCITNYNMCDKY